MKHLLSLLLAVIGFFHSSGQYIEAPVRVASSGAIFLNSKLHPEGTSREIIPIHLPPNTTRWYYSVSAYRNKQDVEKEKSEFDLLGGISKICDRSGIAANVISLIGAPPGADYCNVYLMNTSKDAELFAKQINWKKETINYCQDGSCLNIKSGVKEITDPDRIIGVQYMGIANPSADYGINIDVQIVAIVKKPITKNGWSVQQKNALYSDLKKMIDSKNENHKLTEQQVGDLTACFLDKLTQQYSLADISALAEYEKKEALAPLFNACKSEILGE